MTRNSKTAVICLVLSAAAILCACTTIEYVAEPSATPRPTTELPVLIPVKDPEFGQEQTLTRLEVGLWTADNDSFQNTWSGVAFALPEGWYVYTAEEMARSLPVGDGLLVNDGSGMEAADCRVAYDFTISGLSGMPNVNLYYENLNPGDDETIPQDEAEYYTAQKESLLSIESMKYSQVATERRVVAGQSFYVGTLSLLDGAAYQDMYVRRIEGAMMVMTVTYTQQAKSAAERFIDSIKPSL